MTSGRLLNQSTGTVAGERIVLANTGHARLVGLLGRTHLAAGEGLWITPSSGIHTLGMRFAIDVLALDAGGRVLLLWHALPPWRVPLPRLRIRSVVELAAGEINARDIRRGHLLKLDPAPGCPMTAKPPAKLLWG